MLFEVVSGVGREMGVLDGELSSKGRAVLRVNVGHPVVTIEDYGIYFTMRGDDVALPNLL